MEELRFETLIAVFEEMFGPVLFWVMVGVAVLVTLAYLYVLVRDRRVSWKKFLLAQLSMPVGAVAAVALVLTVTHSQLTDMGGPIDIIVLLGIAAMGAVGMAILVYVLESLIGTRRTSSDDLD